MNLLLYVTLPSLIENLQEIVTEMHKYCSKGINEHEQKQLQK